MQTSCMTAAVFSFKEALPEAQRPGLSMHLNSRATLGHRTVGKRPHEISHARIALCTLFGRGRSFYGFFPKQSHVEATVGNSASDEDEPMDIDSLARRLSQEAERLRRSESGKQASSSSGWPVQSAGEDQIFGKQALERQAEFLARTEGGFAANELEILQQLGRLSWVTEAAKENPLQMSGTSTEQVQAIVAFSARYYSGGPFQDPVKVLLKEFLPAARPVGCNELEIATTLSGMPEMRWQAAVAGLSADPPVVPILGYFIARQSATSAVLAEEELQDTRGSEAALWLVYKWESLQPLTFYPAAEQPRLSTGLQFWGIDVEAEALRARCLMLRSIARGLLAAVAFCHERGVAHGSLGSGSFLMSTFDDRRAGSLVVKMTNFGFAQRWTAAGNPAQAGVPEWQKDDLEATAVVLLETVFSALADGGASTGTSADALKRLVVEVFNCDVDLFRQYTAQESDWTAPAILLDQFGSSGWALIDALISKKRSAADLLNTNAFVDLSAA